MSQEGLEERIIARMQTEIQLHVDTEEQIKYEELWKHSARLQLEVQTKI